METVILAFIILVLAMAGLAVGVMTGRGPIKGSCGGIACHKGLGCGACKARTTREGDR